MAQESLKVLSELATAITFKPVPKNIVALATSASARQAVAASTISLICASEMVRSGLLLLF